MPKIVAVLALTALTTLTGHLSFDAPLFGGRLDTVVFQEGSIPASVTPPLMYAGIRG